MVTAVPGSVGPIRDVDSGLVLAVDLGTTSLKVGIVTLAGAVVWQETHDLEMILLPRGGAVQDAAHWWTLFLDAAARGVRAVTDTDTGRTHTGRTHTGRTHTGRTHTGRTHTGRTHTGRTDTGRTDTGRTDTGRTDTGRTDTGRTDTVVAVAVTGQWASTVPVDGHGEPVGPCLLWLDSRGGAESLRRVGGPVAGYDPRHLLAWVRRTGGVPALDGADPLGHRWYLRAHHPGVYAAARWLMEPVDYLGLRLTGRAAATQASMVAAWLTDNRRLDPGGYDPGLLRRAGLEAGKLAPLLPNGSVLGPLREDVAHRLGLGLRTPVVTGIGDAHTTALGSGAVELYEAHISLGTTSWVSCHVPAKKTDVLHQVAAVPSPLAGRYLVLNNHETSGRCLHWLRGMIDGPDRPQSYEQLDALAAGAEPGSGGVVFTPWLAGERSPIADRNARGGFHNLSLATTRADLVRSVIEGVAYNDRWTFDVVERFVGRRLDNLRLVGGGARSDLWCQIHADVLDRTVEQVAEPQNTGLRGAALGAAIALRVLAAKDVRSLVPIHATYTPSPQRVATYARLYAEFPRLYHQQKRMFARLNDGGRPQTR
jgi:xylulokinase